MAVMLRAQHPKQLQDGLNAIFGIEFKRQPKRWSEIFKTYTSNKAYEEDVLNAGLGAASQKSEGGPVQYDQGGESYVARYQMITISLAFSLSQEAMEDSLYGQLSDRYGSSLARSMSYTKEVHGHQVLNRAFDSNYTGGDGTELCGTHTLWDGSTLANEPATAADLSEDSLEDAFISIRKFVDDRGIPIMTRPMKLVVPVDMEFTTKRIMLTTNAPGNANNDINAAKKMSFFYFILYCPEYKLFILGE